MSDFIFEPMERRRLLAFASVILDVLHVAGTAKNDTIIVQSAKGDPSTTIVTLNGVSESFQRLVTKPIEIEGRRGNDTIRILIDTPGTNVHGVTVSGGGGNDFISAGVNDITASGDDGNDTIYGSGQAHDYLVGGAGSDYLDGGSGSDNLYGDNYQYATGVADSTISSEGDDTLIGGRGDDHIEGQGGKDLIYGNDGADVINGGTGNDKILGGDGTDSITGGTGNDLINGNAGDDTIFGNGGHDTIYGEDGNDSIYGGPDTSDTIFGGNGHDLAAKDVKDTYDSIETLAT